jgi:23S rRNA (adenine2503-C2)-methyltransferase
MTMLRTLLGLDTGEVTALAQDLGQPGYRGRQLAEWVYRRGARAIDDMNNLPAAFREQLSSAWEVGRGRVTRRQTARDGTFKLLIEFGDGACVETVGLPYEDRFSCCVSTQVGCAMGCIFCATGAGGFSRNLTPGEIIAQVLAVAAAAAAGEAAQPVHQMERAGIARVDHVTFMGMGEPLLNYDATIKALSLLNSEVGIAARNLTVSTAGLVPGIRQLAEENLQITLAVSLHAPDDRLRTRLMPGVSRWSVAEVLQSCRDYISRTGRRVTFEYCLLRDVNDSEADAGRLSVLLRGMNCHVNLIPFNGVEGLGVRPTSGERVKRFRKTLERAGIQVTQRMERGGDIDAACGQLRRRESRSPAHTEHSPGDSA